jgi:hypothetical protein
MKVRVLGGSHLGIAGGYGTRIFDIDHPDEIEKIIREEEGLQEATKSSYENKSGLLINTLVDEKGLTLFEWYISEEL